MSGIVRHHHTAIRVGGEDRCRAGLNEHLQLFFRQLPGCTLALDLADVPLDDLSVSGRFIHEDADREICRKVQNIPRETRSEGPEE
ncbi:hypothetical protein [Bryocella elongata]|uniref:hypothetical protein n=1 Tax=Bryocella elongata TaxID=863522 RepID=UPI001F28F02A|nr:hypothetical protein [Bryocella elongata]